MSTNSQFWNELLPWRGAMARAEAAIKRRYGVMRAKKTYTNPYVEVDMWVDLESSSSPRSSGAVAAWVADHWVMEPTVVPTGPLGSCWSSTSSVDGAAAPTPCSQSPT